jgi:hypothetical protein
MVNEIIARCKSGLLPNVIEFGDAALPDAPYITVKPEKHPICGVLYRLILHYLPGQQEYLRAKAREVFELFNNIKLTNVRGKVNIILVENDYLDMTINNDDGTISMERMLWAPGQPYTL